MNGFLHSPEFQTDLRDACELAFRLLGEAQAKYPSVQDLENEVQYRLLRSRSPHRGEASRKTYLTRIAKNLLIDAIRYERAPKRRWDLQVNLFEVDWDSFVGSSAEQADQRILLDECLSRLSNEDRSFFLEYTEGGRTLRDLAEEHYISPTAVANRLKRIIFVLEECCNS